MGYCAKVRIYSHIYCVIVAVFILVSKQVYNVHGASAGSSWPSMKTYDIWGSPQNKVDGASSSSSLHTRRSTLTASNLEIQDNRDKTSFRNEKGIWNTARRKLC